MKRFVVTAVGNVREQYILDAETPEEARAVIEGDELRRHLYEARVAEVSDREVVDVTEIPL